MAYSINLADRVRAFIPAHSSSHPLAEIKMFGGLVFTLGGHMVAGINDDAVMVPVGSEGHERALLRGARELVMGKQVMVGFVGIDDPDDDDIVAWIEPAIARALAKPPKPPKPPKPARSQKES